MSSTLKAASWNEVKAKLATMDRAELVALIRELYGASAPNRTFLHTRFELGPDHLAPYKMAIDRWLWPDFLKHEELSLPRAKKAVTDYRKEVGVDTGLADLMVFWCERASGFAREYARDDSGGYLTALLRMFEDALDVIQTLDTAVQPAFHDRLWAVRDTAIEIGHGVAEEMEDAFAHHGVE